MHKPIGTPMTIGSKSCGNECTESVDVGASIEEVVATIVVEKSGNVSVAVTVIVVVAVFAVSDNVVVAVGDVVTSIG